MKKIYFWSILILFILALLPAGLWAQNDTQRSASDSQRDPNTHITASHAMDVGYAFMRTGNGSKSGGTQSGSVRKQAMQLVYTGRATDTLTHATTDCYYVFALQPKGFVIVAADNRVEPILGYSYDNNFVVENMPEHIKGWLNDYEKQIEVVTKSARLAEADIQTKWNRLESGQPISNTRNDITVGPLLTTTWDQAPYYNTLCPEDPNGPGGHVVTGCVATAMAQIINYWGYPLHGRGSHSYNSNYGTLTVNYDSTYYDYANMPDALTYSSTPEQVNAVAQLMYHCGVAADMEYYPLESSAYDGAARAGLINFFRFSPNLSIAEKSYFTEAEWNNLLQENIADNHPVLYSGSGNNGGHSFVCDGYDADGYYHFNFGWSGSNDGWYLTTAINPSSHAYNSYQSALVGIVPDSTGNVILGQVMGSSTFIVDEQSLEFYHLLGHNAYVGSNYGNSYYSTTIFVSADTTKQLVLDILSYENQYITIYDSVYGNQLATLNVNNANNLSSVVSTSPVLTILYQGYLAYNGFQLSISQDNGCRMVSNITSSIDTNTIHLSWHENGSATQWQIEYGLRGFSHGEGTMRTTNDTAIDITGLNTLREYDVYIRPVCGDNQYGLWSRSVTIMTEAKYWTDVVTSQPEGYMEDEYGNVVVSSAEGLAWWAKQSMPWGSLSIIADIDLTAYLWKPVRSFYGCINGFGHAIENMRIIEHEISVEASQGCGFIRFFYGDTLQNLRFINPIVKSPADISGIIVGHGETSTIQNCCVINGYLESGFYVGLICGSGANAITNCYATGEVHAEGWAGGLVGGTDGNISNCWTDISILTVKHFINGIHNTQTWCGLITAGASGKIQNCFYNENSSIFYMYNDVPYPSEIFLDPIYEYPLLHVLGLGGFGMIYENVSAFVTNDSCAILMTPVLFDTVISNLTTALNTFVQEQNDSRYNTWVWDSTSHLPTYGDCHQVNCINIDSLLVKLVEKDGNPAIAMSWVSDSSLYWQIRITPLDTTDGLPFFRCVNSLSDTITGLTASHQYKIAVRRWCNAEQHSGFGEGVSILFDKKYWTEIVTEQPSGFVMDTDGNVIITSAEGLAWLSSVVNGLNGVPANDFYGKKIWLEADVDMDSYKWLPIAYNTSGDDNQMFVNPFRGSFYGNGHTISNLYCNEAFNYSRGVGLFGVIVEGVIDGVNLVNANLIGEITAGTVVAYASNSIIRNCSAQGVVRSIVNVGGVAGALSYDDLRFNPLIYPEMSSCSFQGTIYGCEQVGGLIGEAYRANIKNVFAQCEIYPNDERDHGNMKKGGLVGTLNSSILENGYSKTTLHYNVMHDYIMLGYSGLVIGLSTGQFGSSVHNVYYENNDNQLLFGYIENEYPTDIIDTSAFTLLDDNTVQLETPVEINDSSYANMLDALNSWVFLKNDPTQRLWVPDSIGYPVFGDFFVPSCYTPNDIWVENLTQHQDSTRIRVSWSHTGSYSYEVKCMYYDNDAITRIFRSDSSSCLIVGLPVGDLNISVRAICDSLFYTPWSDPIYSTLQCPDYWTDIVTSQPESFNVVNGKIIITSTEEMAWLCSVLNGLNGAEYQNIDTIILANDINMSGHKWKSIESFNAFFDGRNYAIKNLYISESSFRDSEKGGFISNNYGVIKNVNFENVKVFGNSFVSGLVMNNYGTIVNCGFTGGVFGVAFVGGFVNSNTGVIENCYIKADVIERSNFSLMAEGGEMLIYENESMVGYFFGGIAVTNLGIISNCYFAGKIESSKTFVASIVTQNYANNQAKITNCYSLTTDTTISLVWDGINSFCSNLTHFQKVANNLSLLESVLIDGVYYTELLSALNAWVDANNNMGIFFHWVADTMGENEGYPIFETIKYYTLNLQVADSTPYGTISGGGIYYNAEPAIIYAIPDNGYHFAQWSDGDISNPRSVKLTQDTTFIAIFAKNLYGVVGNVVLNIDYQYDFEDSTSDNQWMLLDGDNVNRWYVSMLDDTNRALFISNNGGISNLYNPLDNIQTNIFAYTTIILDSGKYNYNYDWRCGGHAGDSYLRVALMPASEQLTPHSWDYLFLPARAIALDGGYSGLCEQTTWKHRSGIVNVSVAGEYRMFFCWRNGRHWFNPPAAVDNIHFSKYDRALDEANVQGYVIGSDTVPYLDTVVLTAIPYEDYRFSHWTDGNIDNPRRVIATADKFYWAVFARAFVISDSIVACDSYQWHGNVYTASTMLFDTLPATGGGDSVVAHYLMVNHPAHTAITETACESYVWTHADGSTQTCMVSGNYTYSHIDANGCTQVDTLHLTIYHAANLASSVSACDSYTWTHADGTTQVCNISDDYIYSYENAYGCPQVDTLHLTVNHATSGEITISACDGFDWHDSTYTESGDYVLTLSNMTGCDSVVTLHLTVNHPAHTAITETACESYVWTHADGTTQTYFASGDYLYSHSDVNGCVQVDTLHLAIHYPSTSVDEQTACGPFTWINGETYTSSVFGPTYILSNEAGCDSVVTLSLTMYHSDTTQFAITACNSFVWGDSTYTETGDYAQTYEGSNGCLSVTIMHLTINYSDTTEESATACDSYLWHGNNYTESGDYTVYYTNTDGCNSMANLHLTVNHSTVGEIVATACENYEWHGIVYTESGDYDYTLTSANGCDSVITLHLTVNENVATEFTITTADSCYIWNGQSYCASGDYTQSFETVNGCDSVVTLHLTITVGIDDYDLANSMKLYPNPTKDVVNVELTMNNEQLDGVSIQVFDVYGRLLEVINMADAHGASPQTTQIDLSRYAQGVYFVKAESEGKVIAVRKVVKR